MTAFWIGLLFLTQGTLFLCAISHLGREVKRLRAQVASLDRSSTHCLDLHKLWKGETVDPDPKHNQGTSTPDPLWKRLADVERLAASHESACELNASGLEAQTALSILHAETVTRLQSRVDKLAHDPHYQKPVRRDN